MRIVTILFSILCLSASFAAAGTQGYYRFPALAPEGIIFTAEGDLWMVGMQGGAARRITSHPGMESRAAVSPDGLTVAFSAQYEGPLEVYTMPVDGGLPVRRTFEGESAVVIGWTPDGRIIYSTGHFSTIPNRQLAVIDPTSGAQSLLQLNQASDGCYDSTGSTLYFTRLPFQGSHTKRYKGGTAQNIWKLEKGAREAVPLTADYPGTSKIPMYQRGRIYFVSDRDGTMNLWSMTPDGGDLRQMTTHKDWDVKYPSERNGLIAYQCGADIYVYDCAAGTTHPVPITLQSDFDQTRELWVKKPSDYLTSTSISPDGGKVALTAHGQIFTVPAEQGRFVRVTHNDGVRYRSARFTADGKSLIALSDESGELEFWKLPANGAGPQKRITTDASIFRADGLPSPDSQWIAFDDKNQHLWLASMTTGKITAIDSSDMSGFSNLCWSPDGKYLAYDVSAENTFQVIRLYHVTDGSFIRLTSDRNDSYNAVWTPDGKWIYFLSDRYFQSLVGSPWGPRQPEPFFDKTTEIYAVPLLSDTRFPFQPPDELSAKTPEQAKKDSADAKKKKVTGVTIDAEEIQSRIYKVPVSAGTYRSLSVNDKALFWLESDVSASPKSKLAALEIKNKDISSKTLMEDVAGYDLSTDGKKILVRKEQDLYVIDAGPTPPSEPAKSKVDLSAWSFSITPRDEWRQMFAEAWRLERDFFYDPHLHGNDYQATFRHYQPLLDRVTDRDELNDLISGMVSELAALHTFVVGGDVRQSPDKIYPASLGARLERDPARDGYRITHIYRTDPSDLSVVSPLARPELHIREGDIIRSINGTPVLSVESPSILLRNMTGQQVLLGIAGSASGEETRKIVKPISLADEANLRYTEWEYTRRLSVEEAGRGEIGYVHLRAMGGGNYTEWVKNFYPVFDRKGLIIDVRHNRGGNIDSWILEKLLRKAWFFWKPRVGQPTWNMQYAFRGHIVVLCDEFTASDGEAFTEGFKRLGLGKVIGTRTWGGEIWLSFDTYLADNGIASAAETGVYGPEGKWLIEGHGVDPDTTVDNLPVETFQGTDRQLDAAIQYLKEQIRLHPVEVPPAPEYPIKR